MTLLIAQVSNASLWMIADTFISGGSLRVRGYEHEIKILTANHQKAILGFAGEAFHGIRSLEKARAANSHSDAIEILRNVSREYPVEFAYGYLDTKEPILLHISDGKTKKTPSLHLGIQSAFEQYQEIRHKSEIDPVPLSVSTFILGCYSKLPPPDGVLTSIVAMLRLFVERSERDVGGAVIAYVLDSSGAHLCGYGYSVSDPITDKLRTGNDIPHGTASSGGFGLSVTQLGDHEGIIIYWLQKPGGLVFVRQQNGYEIVSTEGGPNEFIKQASAKVGKPVEIFFSETSQEGLPDSITLMSDQNGKPVVAVARYGRTYSFTAIDVSEDFKTRAIRDELNSNKISSVATASVSKTKDEITLTFTGEPGKSLTLSPEETDELITLLASVRAQMTEQISLQPPTERGLSEAVVVDPAWRTDHSPHPALDGIILRLRHTGLGWIAFLIPHHEAIAISEWLSNAARR